MKGIAFILNLPWTVLGLLLGLLSIPKSFHTRPGAIVIDITKFWWAFGYMKGVRAAAMGNVVLLGSHVLPGDFEHELVHVQQHTKYPLIFPLLYYTELLRHGYRKNRFEEEAYSKTGNKFIS